MLKASRRSSSGTSHLSTLTNCYKSCFFYSLQLFTRLKSMAAPMSPHNARCWWYCPNNRLMNLTPVLKAPLVPACHFFGQQNGWLFTALCLVVHCNRPWQASFLLVLATVVNHNVANMICFMLPYMYI